MSFITRSLKEMLRYPSAIAGLILVAILLGIGAYAMIRYPYQEAVRLWRGGEEVWYRSPTTAPPSWINHFRAEKLVETVVLNSADGTAEKTFTPSGDGQIIDITYTVEFPYTTFPQDVILYFDPVFEEKAPFVGITWERPNGEKLNIATFSAQRGYSYRFSQDAKLSRRLGGLFPQEGIFALEGSDPLVAEPGTYILRMQVITFEPDADMNAELVMHGQVSGWAGTDHLRRDLGVALLWGIPIALAFGLLATLGTSVSTMIIAGVGAWFGGWVDEIIQRITEVNLLLPLLPILIMIGTFYSRSIWVILGVTILFSIFGGGIKTYRAIFMQVRELPYIEAARAYGATDRRIIMHYLVPRIIPLLIPGLVSGIPGYVFLEAALAVLGLGDPILPTWGKVIQDAQGNGALYNGQYYWVLEPAVLLMITGLAFAMLGFALDRVFNPRLRGM